MATIKSYTNIEQSRKLAEILPIESADMYYFTIIRDYPYSQGKIKTIAKIMDGSFSSDYDTPCWSLAALLEQLPYEVCDDDGNSSYLQMDKEDDVYQLVYTDPHGDFESIETDRYEHFVDACYEMIIKLSKLSLL